MIIKYFAWLKDITKIEDEEILDNKIKDINTLKEYLSKKYPKLEKYFKEDSLIRVAINLEYTVNNNKISSKDEIALFPPVSGG
tara:strand:+ start:367 stop:615 length:249 start_codon:yes stop_codon:yes gene_type:complete